MNSPPPTVQPHGADSGLAHTPLGYTTLFLCPSAGKTTSFTWCKLRFGTSLSPPDAAPPLLTWCPPPCWFNPLSHLVQTQVQHLHTLGLLHRRMIDDLRQLDGVTVEQVPLLLRGGGVVLGVDAPVERRVRALHHGRHGAGARGQRRRVPGVLDGGRPSGVARAWSIAAAGRNRPSQTWKRLNWVRWSAGPSGQKATVVFPGGGGTSGSTRVQLSVGQTW